MTAESSTVIEAELDRLAAEFVDAWQRAHGTLPTVPRDTAWTSVAEVGPAPDDQMFWQPTRRHDALSFADLSSALEVDIPPVCDVFYGHFWSAGLPVLWGERPFELLQLWNAEDQNNLMHNLLGHALEKKRVREPLTVFFAVIDDARFLSIDAASQAIMLEEVGGDRPEQVAGSLAQLLSELTAVAASEMPA